MADSIQKSGPKLLHPNGCAAATLQGRREMTKEEKLVRIGRTMKNEMLLQLIAREMVEQTELLKKVVAFEEEVAHELAKPKP